MFDHPWILILIGIAGFLRWLYEKSQAGKDEPKRPTESGQQIPRAAPNSEEERIRRFLEALGQPTTSTPPPKVAPKTETPRRTFVPQIPSILPPLTSVPPPLPDAPAPVIEATPPPAPVEPRIFQPTIVQDSVFEVHDLGVPSVLPAPARRAFTAQDDLLRKLASTEGLRSAIILREVFGPPRSLQAVEAFSGF